VATLYAAGKRGEPERFLRASPAALTDHLPAAPTILALITLRDQIIGVSSPESRLVSSPAKPATWTGIDRDGEVPGQRH